MVLQILRTGGEVGMTDFLKIVAWFLICLCIVILAGRFYGLQERVEQLEKVVKIEEQAVKWNDNAGV